MDGHPFRVAPPDSGGAHCVQCGRQLPHAELRLDVDGTVVCGDCRPAPPYLRPIAHEASPASSTLMTTVLCVVLVLGVFMAMCVSCRR